MHVCMSDMNQIKEPSGMSQMTWTNEMKWHEHVMKLMSEHEMEYMNEINDME